MNFATKTSTTGITLDALTSSLATNTVHANNTMLGGNTVCLTSAELLKYGVIGCDMGGGYMAIDKKEYRPEKKNDPVCVAKVETYNGKVVKVTFADGSFEKAVCSDVDTFSVDVGITICVLKKMLGKDGHKKYNKLMRDVHKLMEKQVIDKVAERDRKAAAMKKAERAKEKAKQRKEKAREDYIDAHVEALMRFNAKKQA